MKVQGKAMYYWGQVDVQIFSKSENALPPLFVDQVKGKGPLKLTWEAQAGAGFERVPPLNQSELCSRT